jgi:hypothetical protein
MWPVTERLVVNQDEMFLEEHLQRQAQRQLPVTFGARDCGFLTLERLGRRGSCLKKSGSSPMK